MLAHAIVIENEKVMVVVGSEKVINFKGFTFGNPLTVSWCDREILADVEWKDGWARGGGVTE